MRVSTARGRPQLRTLIIDNYDSFTFNLFQYLAEANQEEPIVIKNDELDASDLDGLTFDNVVISPGPGRPDVAADFGVCAAIIRRHAVPILGVCLGHQGIGHLFGGRVVHAPQVMHGRASRIRHSGDGLFRGIPSPFSAIRYHSLIVDIASAPDLEAIAHADDNVLMGLAHRSLPIWGVQFHPESICTEHGMDLIRNFRDLSLPYRRARPQSVRLPAPEAVRARPTVQLRTRRLRLPVSAEAVFHYCYGASRSAFWLDSSMVKPGLSRFSFMGDATGPRAEVVTYCATERRLHSRRFETERSWHESVFDYLERTTAVDPVADEILPFGFRGGWVGYLGYELKGECGGRTLWPSTQPDACFIFADRFIAFDHEHDEVWLVEMVDPDAPDTPWLDIMAARLMHLPAPPPPRQMPPARPVELRLRHGKTAYIDAIRAALEEIDAGESYEICLTNQITADLQVDGLSLHRILRHINPAPFAAFLRFDGLEIISASPERFLRVGPDGAVEAKPIKGTAPRGQTAEQDARNAAELQSDEKSRAENLMIVDLLRNDIGTVCRIGSVGVPKLMAIESYATVHQLVTTVTGRLRPECSAVRCVQRAFPGGSMTGAPKIRTLDILDRLEASPRGVYSGAIGYFGLGGTADLNIVIRTIVAQDGRLSIGVGGAIVALSDPEAEYQEILLKAKAPIRAILLATGGSDDAENYRLIEDGSYHDDTRCLMAEAQP